MASHSGATGLNNLDFWKDKNLLIFGIYMKCMISNLNFIYLIILFTYQTQVGHIETVIRIIICAKEIDVTDGHDLIYCLIHPETYYDQHFYE